MFVVTYYCFAVLLACMLLAALLPIGLIGWTVVRHLAWTLDSLDSLDLDLLKS